MYNIGVLPVHFSYQYTALMTSVLAHLFHIKHESCVLASAEDQNQRPPVAIKPAVTQDSVFNTKSGYLLLMTVGFYIDNKSRGHFKIKS